MNAKIHDWLFLTIAGLAIGFTACSNIQSDQHVSTAIPISDIQTVAGKWEGLAKSVPPSRREDWAELTIEKDGTYRFGSFRTIGAAVGHGSLAVTDGKLYSETAKGSATYTLYERDGRHALLVDIVLRNGLRYHLDLERAKLRH
jgi:hypothetical protein